MRIKYINSTSGRKSVTGNGFSDTDFLRDANKKFACKRKPTFKGTLSKLVKNRKSNYAHARKSLSVSHRENLLLFGKVNLIPNMINIGRELGAHENELNRK